LTSTNEAPEVCQDEDAGDAFDTVNKYTDPRFDYAHSSARSSLAGDLITKYVSLNEIIERRKRNFQILKERCESLSGATLVGGDQITHETPYVFPLLVDDAERIHKLFRKAEFPVWRWDDIRQSDCPVSRDYSRRLIQFPCHQGLTRRQVESIGRLLAEMVA
jgi:dTDP-4-amino-4,6-dideoxygalactose transaminase